MDSADGVAWQVFPRIAYELTTGIRCSELPCKVELYALVPEEVRLGTTGPMSSFLEDKSYSLWRWFYNCAAKNILIRRKEKPLSLRICASPTSSTEVPKYSGMATCCSMHHINHVQGSLELSQNTCEIELEASYAFREWLVRETGHSDFQADCLEREAKVADKYIQAIQERLKKVKMARSVYNMDRQDFSAFIPEDAIASSVITRVESELQALDIQELLTPYPVTPPLATEDAEPQAEEQATSRPSHSERELEKVHPERIEFLTFIFESCLFAANREACKLDSNNVPKEGIPSWHTPPISRPEAVDKPRHNLSLFLSFCGLVHPLQKGTVMPDCLRRREVRRSRQAPREKRETEVKDELRKARAQEKSKLKEPSNVSPEVEN